MIVETLMQGSRETTLHTFTFAANEMDLIMSIGEYVRGGMQLAKSDVVVTIPIATHSEDTHYELWLTKWGLTLLHRKVDEEYGVIEGPIDLLVWFTLPAGKISLDDVEINARRMEEMK